MEREGLDFESYDVRVSTKFPLRRVLVLNYEDELRVYVFKIKSRCIK